MGFIVSKRELVWDLKGRDTYKKLSAWVDKYVDKEEITKSQFKRLYGPNGTKYQFTSGNIADVYIDRAAQFYVWLKDKDLKDIGEEDKEVNMNYFSVGDESIIFNNRGDVTSWKYDLTNITFLGTFIAIYTVDLGPITDEDKVRQTRVAIKLKQLNDIAFAELTKFLKFNFETDPILYNKYSDSDIAEYVKDQSKVHRVLDKLHELIDKAPANKAQSKVLPLRAAMEAGVISNSISHKAYVKEFGEVSRSRYSEYANGEGIETKYRRKIDPMIEEFKKL